MSSLQVSVGSTAYAWIHVDAENTATTLDTLAVAPFNKLRMTVFPKWYPYSHIEPQPRIYPYEPKKPFGECYICCNISNVCKTFSGGGCDISGAAANEEWVSITTPAPSLTSRGLTRGRVIAAGLHKVRCSLLAELGQGYR